MAPPEPSVDSSNPETLHENNDSNNHKKRRKIGDHASDHTSLNLVPWRSQSEQQIYSTKLLRALRHVLRRNPSPTAASKPRLVRQAADRALAAAAKGRTRWSRAILSAQSSSLRRNHKKAKKPYSSASAAVTRVKRERSEGERRRLPAVQRKARVLGRLVPGCRKISFPNLLEEATDYISALEMQVRAMTAVAELLSGGATSRLDAESLS